LKIKQDSENTVKTTTVGCSQFKKSNKHKVLSVYFLKNTAIEKGLKRMKQN